MTRINTNVSSSIAQSNLARSQASLQTALQRLSTGLRINVGKDDPAGLIASETLRSDITSIERTITNSERANQLIATADSGLGQVSSLLNDIRGLVSEAANTGALSQEQIQANQLQVDSSLEAIDRIAQTTAFQGRKLLDGSLDFTTTSPGNNVTTAAASISLGAVAATADLNLGEVAATGSITVGAAAAATTTVSATGANNDFTLTAKSVGTTANGFQVIFTAGGSAGAPTISVNGTTSVEIQLTGDVTASEVLQALSANAGFNALFSVSLAGGDDGTGTINTSAGIPTTVTTSAGSNASAINLSAVTAGTGPNAYAIDITSGATEAAALSGSSFLITVTAGSTATSIANTISASGVLSATVSGAGSSVLSAGATISDLTGGATAAVIALTAVTAGVGANAYAIDVTSGATESAALSGSSFLITVTAGSTATTVANAISASGVFSASISGSGTQVVSAGATPTNPTGGTTGAVLELTAVSAGSGPSGLSISLIAGSAGATAAVALSGSNLQITLTAGSTASSVASLISANGTFTATVSGSGTQVISAGSTVVAPTGGLNNGGNISDLRIDQANFGTQSSIAVEIEIDAQASQGQLTYSGGALSADLVLEVGGKSGFEVFNFGSGNTTAQIRDAINLASDATGVSASLSGTDLVFRSTEYGTNAFVSLRTLSGSFDTYAGASATDRDVGSDVQARINGVAATGDGLLASINTSTLDLSFKVNDSLSAGDTVNFSITGGGATFQLGPDVVSNQQARLGIQGVNTATLGGSDGSLYELRTGGAKALATDVKGAAQVVDQVISKVTSLRGRLGAFQKTTLETNIFTLTDTLQSLTDTQSSIRDADFAKESAALTRAQILVQAGTSVLTIANQNPQQVLALLR